MHQKEHFFLNLKLIWLAVRIVTGNVGENNLIKKFNLN